VLRALLDGVPSYFDVDIVRARQVDMDIVPADLPHVDSVPTPTACTAVCTAHTHETEHKGGNGENQPE
jgi:hypothetical protein